MQKISKILSVAAAMAVILPTIALADTTTPTSGSVPATANVVTVRPQTLSGKVTSVSGNIITFTAGNGGIYTADATNAKILRRYGSTMLVADIQTGDEISVRGTVSGSNITATTVRDSSLQERNATFSGSVTSVGSNSFVLQSTSRGQQTVNVSSTTVIKKSGSADQFSDIMQGSKVTVSGVWDNVNNNISAETVNIIIKRTVLTGTFASLSGTTITMTVNGTTYTVDASSAGIIRKYGAKMALTDIQSGDTLQVLGIVNSTNVKASAIRDMSQQQRNATFSGTVTSVSTSSFVLQTSERSQQTVNVSSTTVIDKNGQPDQYSDIVQGSTLTVSGVWDSTNNTIAANKINIVVKMVGVNINGTLSSISGEILTIAGTDGTTYTVDATNARLIREFGGASSLSEFKTGDSLRVEGKHVSTSSTITASVIRDNSITAKTVNGDSKTETPSATTTPPISAGDSGQRK